MEAVVDFLKHPRAYNLILLLAGIATLLLSRFDVSTTPFQIARRGSVDIYTLLIAIGLFALFALGVLLEFLSKKNRLAASGSFSSGNESLPIFFGNLQVDVRFGKIEESTTSDAIALPVNEYFDSDCLKDPKSSTGAYFLGRFRDQFAQVEQVLQTALSDLKSQSIEKNVGEVAKSYGTGIAVPLAFPGRLIFLISMSRQRPGRGIHCYEDFVFAGVRSLNELCHRYRVQSLDLPLLGSGHGGMIPRRALIALLLALASISGETHLRTVTIVIYKGDPKKPKIDEREVSFIVGSARWLQAKVS
jgi:Domain of unknown function (DUF6430)